jgi:hypothetical protein
VRRSSEAPGQLAGDGAEQLTLVRAPVVVFERQKSMNQIDAKPLGKSRAGGAGDLACRGGSIWSFYDNPTLFQT